MKTHIAIVLGLLVVTSTGCASLFESPFDKLERRMMFHPVRLRKSAPVAKSVASVWIPSELHNDLALQLHGVLAEAPRPAEQRAVALYCHGNAGCVDGCIDKIRKTADQFNVTILAFDYRGFGRSDGKPDTAGIVADARAARKWLAEREKISERSIVLIGESLGGGVAVELAGTDGCRGLVLLSTFSSLGDIAEELGPAILSPRKRVGDKLNSIATIKSYHGPLLQRHGDADRLIPIAQGKQLFEAAPGPKKFIAVAGGTHDECASDEFYTALDEFFRCIPPVE